MFGLQPYPPTREMIIFRFYPQRCVPEIHINLRYPIFFFLGYHPPSHIQTSRVTLKLV